MMHYSSYSEDTEGGPGGTRRSGVSSTQQLELMQSSRESKLGSEAREPFTTIDDLVQQAQELFAGLKKLSENKHPLEIRRGVGKGVVDQSMPDNGKSIQIKGAGRTYFVDLEETKAGKPYIRITESRKGKKEDWIRNTIVVFLEDAKRFGRAISKAVSRISE